MKPVHVYLAGPIFQQDDGSAKDWRREVAALSYATVLDPMRRDYRGKEDESVAAIVEGDKADLLHADYVIAHVERPSAGTSMEILFAWQMHKPVIAITDAARVSPWIRYHADSVVPDVASAVYRVHQLMRARAQQGRR